MTTDPKPHTWRSPDGLRLFARDHGAPTDRLPVVCIPGLTRNSRDFEDVAPWIAAQGRRVLAVDLRGRGLSEYDLKKRYRPPIYAQDIAALLASIGSDKAIFIGTSLGGLVTTALAARQPDMIGAAVLNDVGPRIAKAGLKRISAYAGKTAPVETWDDAAAYVRRTNGAAFPSYKDADWMTVARRTFRDTDGKPVLDYDPAIFSPPSPLVVRLLEPLMWGAFKRLAKAGPLLLVHGELTDVIDDRTIIRMKRAAPRLEVSAVPCVGHAPMLSEPTAREALAAFLSHAP